MTMRRLMLLRHAKSDWSEPGQRDHERALAPRGRKAAPQMGKYMTRHGLKPDSAIVSSARRTRETWELVREKLGDPPARFDDRIYEASPIAILDVIQETSRAAKTLLVVGHNPGLQTLAMSLIGSGDIETRGRIADKFPTAGLVVIDFPHDDWTKLHPGAGRLELFVTPRALETAPD